MRAEPTEAGEAIVEKDSLGFLGCHVQAHIPDGAHDTCRGDVSRRLSPSHLSRPVLVCYLHSRRPHSQEEDTPQYVVDEVPRCGIHHRSLWNLAQQFPSTLATESFAVLDRTILEIVPHDSGQVGGKAVVSLRPPILSQSRMLNALAMLKDIASTIPSFFVTVPVRDLTRMIASTVDLP